MKCNFHIRPGCIFLILISILPLRAEDETGIELFRKGRAHIRERNWEKALHSLASFEIKYPNSIYADDALFWTGFSLEQLNREDESLRIFNDLVDRYTESLWLDDAKVHMIQILRKSTEKDLTFRSREIKRYLSDADSAVQIQAVLALGSLGNQDVLPRLKQLAQGDDVVLSKSAIEILEQLAGNGLDIPSPVESDLSPAISAESEVMLDERLLPGPQGWSPDGLELHALMHILPPEDFRFFLNLENEWDRRKWLKQFWGHFDPTPTTEQNEAMDDFEARIKTAYKLFQTDYIKAQKYQSPWDFRGALTIQYGLPDKREQAKEGWEKWSYYNYRVGFLVSTEPFKHNESGVRLGNWTRMLYGDSIERMHDQFIGRPTFRYFPNDFVGKRKIRNMRFYLDSAEAEGVLIRAGFWFRFPADHIHAREESGKLVSRFKGRWVVHDEEYNQVFVDSLEFERTFRDRFVQQKSVITDAIDVPLSEGVYTISLRIEDLQSRRLGIYRRKFWLQRTPEAETQSQVVSTKQDSLVSMME